MVHTVMDIAYRGWSLAKFAAALLVILALVALFAQGIYSGVTNDSSSGKTESGHSSSGYNPDGYNPGGYSTLFYDPEPPELTPEQELDLLGPSLLDP